MSTDPRPRLLWKYEDGPEDAEDGDDREIGPAWLDGEPVNDGEWITRGEARRLAEENGWDVDWDDGLDYDS